MEKTTLDLINSFVFELASCLFLLLNIKSLYRDGVVKGISLASALFYSLWACWNIYYYFSLNQTFSFYISIVVAVLSMWWIGLAFWYNRNDFVK